MFKFWTIAIYEYRRLVFTRKFIIVILSVPLLIGVMVGLGLLLESMDKDTRPVGYVDHAGIIANTVPESIISEYDDPIDFNAYQSTEEADQAVNDKTIQAYFIIAEDYKESLDVELVFRERHAETIISQFKNVLRVNLLAEQDEEITERILAGSEVTVRSPDGQREFSGPLSLGQLLPLFGGVAFIILIFISSGYLVGVVADEKENRTIEILSTSASNFQLIGGKLCGIIAVTFTQMIIWSSFVFALIAYVSAFGEPFFQNISVDMQSVMYMIILLIPAYVLIASLMTAIGAMVSSVEASQQIAGMFVGLIYISLVMIPFVLENPVGPLAVGMTLFPLTAPTIIPLRVILTDVPVWQIASGIGLLVGSALFGVWLASRAFRMGMLRYGKSLRLGEIFGKTKLKHGKEASHE